MNDDCQSHTFGPGDSVPRKSVTIGDIFRRLDRSAPYAPPAPSNHVGLDELMTWMAEEPSSEPSELSRAAVAPQDESDEHVNVKILIAGGRGAGAIDFIGTLAVPPSDRFTMASTSEEGMSGEPAAPSGEVVVDFGRMPLDANITIYLFAPPAGTPGGPVWDRLASGAIGVVVMVDPQRLGDSRAAIDHLERSGIPYTVTVSALDSSNVCEADIRTGLCVSSDIPVAFCDLCSPGDVKGALIALVARALEMRATGAENSDLSDELAQLILSFEPEAVRH